MSLKFRVHKETAPARPLVRDPYKVEDAIQESRLPNISSDACSEKIWETGKTWIYVIYENAHVNTPNNKK